MSNVITFISSASNTGTTSTTLSVAYTLAQHTELKIGVLSLNAWDDSTDFISDPPVYLNEIKSRLAGQSLEDDEDFLSKFYKVVKTDNLYVLAGNRDRLMERLFYENEADYLIKRSKDVFDIVLIDAGCHFDNALSAQSLLRADKRYLILTQQPKVIKRFLQLDETIFQGLNIKKNDFGLIVNFYKDEPYLQTKKGIAKILDLNLVEVIQETPNGWLSEVENKILCTYDDGQYQKSILTIAKDIAHSMGIEFTESPRKRRSLVRLFA